MRGHWNKICRHCEQPIPEEWNLELTRKRAEVRLAKNAEKRARGEPIGRPRTRDRNAILALREQGLTMRQIADRIGCSTYTVQAAIKEKDARRAKGEK